MSDRLIVIVTGVVLAGVSIFLFAMSARSIIAERRSSRLRKTWANFALSITFAVLFVLSWASQAVAEWGVYRPNSRPTTSPPWSATTWSSSANQRLENWQSEFLQLFSFVVLSAMLTHHGSAESKDSDDRMERKIDQIVKQLDEMDSR